MSKFRSAGLLILTVTLVVPLIGQTMPLDALLRGGRIHYDGQRYERAREQFQKALDQYGPTADNATFAMIQVWLGLCEAQLKNYPTAAEHFALALERDSAVARRIQENEQWLYHASVSLLNTARDGYFAGNYEPMLRYALAAVKIDPTKPAVYTLIANIFSQLGRYEDMRRTAEDLLKLDRRSAEAFSLLGLYFLQKPDSLWADKILSQTRWDSAAAYYDSAIAIYSERFSRARQDLASMLKINDSAAIDGHVWQLINRSRSANSQAELKDYIEKTLKAGKQLAEYAGIAGRLATAATQLNSANSRAGSAMLSAAAQTPESLSNRFRARAENYFRTAIAYDSADFTAIFDLGIAYYQGRNDSGAEQALLLVTQGSTIRLTELPAALQDSLINQIRPEVQSQGNLQLSGPLVASIDSAATALGRRGIGYNWFYFTELRDRPTPPTAADRNSMFVSLLQPELLEQAFLWLGSSQTGLGTTLANSKQTDAARAKFLAAVDNLLMATKLNPRNADAYQNLGICYRELGDKQKALNAFETADRIRKGK